ncbi:hypothetical protein GCM10023169_31050 [Georgenia halophila]|uniref:Uncharacterized protein n=1 Tax=Georgenia halophila TaxID=620889 RepID=A0ABP8LJ41_9MICO
MVPVAAVALVVRVLGVRVTLLLLVVRTHHGRGIRVDTTVAVDPR